jgi:hypothetical protein
MARPSTLEERLRAIGEVDQDRLVEIHAFLFQSVVFYHQVHVVVLPLDVRLAKRETKGTHVAEVFRFVEIELIVIPFAAPLQRYELFVVLRDRAAKIIARGVQFSLQILLSLGEVLPGLL